MELVLAFQMVWQRTGEHTGTWVHSFTVIDFNDQRVDSQQFGTKGVVGREEGQLTPRHSGVRILIEGHAALRRYREANEQAENSTVDTLGGVSSGLGERKSGALHCRRLTSPVWVRAT